MSVHKYSLQILLFIFLSLFSNISFSGNKSTVEEEAIELCHNKPEVISFFLKAKSQTQRITQELLKTQTLLVFLITNMQRFAFAQDFEKFLTQKREARAIEDQQREGMLEESYQTISSTSKMMRDVLFLTLLSFASIDDHSVNDNLFSEDLMVILSALLSLQKEDWIAEIKESQKKIHNILSGYSSKMSAILYSESFQDDDEYVKHTQHVKNKTIEAACILCTAYEAVINERSREHHYLNAMTQLLMNNQTMTDLIEHFQCKALIDSIHLPEFLKKHKILLDIKPTVSDNKKISQTQYQMNKYTLFIILNCINLTDAQTNLSDLTCEELDGEQWNILKSLNTKIFLLSNLLNQGSCCVPSTCNPKLQVSTKGIYQNFLQKTMLYALYLESEKEKTDKKQAESIEKEQAEILLMQKITEEVKAKIKAELQAEFEAALAEKGLSIESNTGRQVSFPAELTQHGLSIQPEELQAGLSEQAFLEKQQLQIELQAQPAQPAQQAQQTQQTQILLNESTYDN